MLRRKVVVGWWQTVALIVLGMGSRWVRLLVHVRKPELGRGRWRHRRLQFQVKL